MIEGSLIVFGVMISYWIDLGFSFLEPSSIAWRFPIGFQIILALFVIALIPGLPESPRWLVLKGRNDEALVVLAALSDLTPEDKKIQAEFQAVKDVAFEMSKGGFRDCFKMNRNRNFHRTALAYVNQMFQQVRIRHHRLREFMLTFHSDFWHQPRHVLRGHDLRELHWFITIPQSTSICLQRYRVLVCFVDRYLHDREVRPSFTYDLWCSRHVVFHGRTCWRN